MSQASTGNATLFSQENGLQVSIGNSMLSWTFGNDTQSTAIVSDDAFHHYVLNYDADAERMSVYIDDQAFERQEVGPLEKSNTSTLTIGGNTFVGNLHDLRFWSRSLSLADAVAGMNNELTGLERNLTGYWPMNEGAGAIALDLARFRHAAMDAEWDIRPKGTAYDFDGSVFGTRRCRLCTADRSNGHQSFLLVEKRIMSSGPLFSQMAEEILRMFCNRMDEETNGQ